jgi:hypothetical protein
MAPSGNSFALTYPGVFGSRVGAGGRAPLLTFAGACLSVGRCTGVWAIAGPTPATRQIKNALVGPPGMQISLPSNLNLQHLQTHLGQPGFGVALAVSPVLRANRKLAGKVRRSASTSGWPTDRAQ